jgi:hypothetical protein
MWSGWTFFPGCLHALFPRPDRCTEKAKTAFDQKLIGAFNALNTMQVAQKRAIGLKKARFLRVQLNMTGESRYTLALAHLINF